MCVCEELLLIILAEWRTRLNKEWLAITGFVSHTFYMRACFMLQRCFSVASMDLQELRRNISVWMDPVTSDTPYDQRPPKYMSTLHAIGAAKLFQLNICILSYSVQRRTGHQYYIYCYSPEYNPMIDPSAMIQDKTKNTIFLYQDDDVPHFQVIFNKR